MAAWQRGCVAAIKFYPYFERGHVAVWPLLTLNLCPSNVTLHNFFKLIGVILEVIRGYIRGGHKFGVAATLPPGQD